MLGSECSGCSVVTGVASGGWAGEGKALYSCCVGSFSESGVTVQRIKGYHAHVYYDASTLEQARELCEEATKLFGVSMGRLHQKPVGPHPDWSCQLAFGPELVGVVLPWLALYRKGLVVFLHPLTGDELADHRDHAIWMGAIRPLDLSLFE